MYYSEPRNLSQLTAKCSTAQMYNTEEYVFLVVKYKGCPKILELALDGETALCSSVRSSFACNSHDV